VCQCVARPRGVPVQSYVSSIHTFLHGRCLHLYLHRGGNGLLSVGMGFTIKKLGQSANAPTVLHRDRGALREAGKGS
jgi:hypothetical protein